MPIPSSATTSTGPPGGWRCGWPRPGLRPVILPKGTGMLVDIGSTRRRAPLVALRADLDALPLSDEKHVPYRSTVPNVCHACGHDVHTTVVMGAGLFLASLAAPGPLHGPGPADLPARRGSARRAPST